MVTERFGRFWHQLRHQYVNVTPFVSYGYRTTTDEYLRSGGRPLSFEVKTPNILNMNILFKQLLENVKNK